MKKRSMLMFAGAAAGAILLSAWWAGIDGFEEDIIRLYRNDSGQGTAVYELKVKGLVKEEVVLPLELEPRVSSKEEAAVAFEAAHQRLKEDMLGENPSLDQVRFPLKLAGSLPESGIEIRWQTDEPEILDTIGRVYNNSADFQARLVMLTANLTDGTHQAAYEFEIHVLPVWMTEEEKRLMEFAAYMKTTDANHRQDPYLELPMEYEGRRLQYREAEESQLWLLPVLFLLSLALLYGRRFEQKKAAAEKRKRQLLLDYSEIVSKLLVLLGAGMTVRSAWERIVKDYEAGGSDAAGRRYAYEEMIYTYGQLASGAYEGQAYGAFGRRCGLHSYLKLGNLLEQNLRTGTKNLRNLLESEMIEALEQRKAAARQLGEEAGTKLLIPMILMLAVIMVMIMVPAMLTFG